MDLSRTSHLTYSMSGTLAASCPRHSSSSVADDSKRSGEWRRRDGQSNRGRYFFWRWRNAVLISLGMKGKVFVRQAARARGCLHSLPPSLSLSPDLDLSLSLLWILWRSIPFFISFSLSSGQAAAQVGEGHQEDQGEEEGVPGERTRRP